MENKAQDRNKLILTFRGRDSDGGSMRIEDLADGLKAVRDVLSALDKIKTRGKEPSLLYHVVGMSMNSPAIMEIEAVPKTGMVDISDEVLKSLLSGLEHIRNSQLTTELDPEILGVFSKMGAPLKRNNSTLDISYRESKTQVSGGLKELIDKVQGPDQTELSWERGDLEIINLHNEKNIFHIYPLVGARVIKCHFPDSLLPQVREGISRFVEVHGTFHTKKHQSFPHFAEIEEIKILPEAEDADKNLTFFRSLRGMAKGAYNGKSALEHIAEIRDEWE